jgi:hypothetical protein
MLSLEEAIAHCLEVAEKNDKIADTFEETLKNKITCRECAKEHRQLAEWLRELKAFHDAMDIIPTTPFNVDLGEIPINNRSYDDIVKCLMIAYERGKNDTLSLIEQYILGGKR